jgi:hypothetical protein
MLLCLAALMLAQTDFTLVATVTGDTHPVALLTDRNGKGLLVRQGSFVGGRRWRVSKITGECVALWRFETPRAIRTVKVCLDRSSRQLQAQRFSITR